MTISSGCVGIINISHNRGKILLIPPRLRKHHHCLLRLSQTIVSKSRLSPVVTDFYPHLQQSHKILGKSCGHGNIIVFDDPGKIFTISQTFGDIIVVSCNCSKLLSISYSNGNSIVSQYIKSHTVTGTLSLSFVIMAKSWISSTVIPFMYSVHVEKSKTCCSLG